MITVFPISNPFPVYAKEWIVLETPTPGGSTTKPPTTRNEIRSSIKNVNANLYHLCQPKSDTALFNFDSKPPSPYYNAIPPPDLNLNHDHSLPLIAQKVYFEHTDPRDFPATLDFIFRLISDYAAQLHIVRRQTNAALQKAFSGR